MSLSSLLLGPSKSTHAAIDKGLDDLFKLNSTVCVAVRENFNGVVDHLTLLPLSLWFLHGSCESTNNNPHQIWNV